MKALNNQEDEYIMSLTPLVDVVFLLLVFFLVSTSFVRREKSIDIKLPVADQAPGQPEPSNSLIVNVHENGLFVADGRMLTGEEEVAQMLYERVQADPKLSVIIRGDRRAVHNDIVRVMNAALSVGIDAVSVAVFETEQE